MSLMMPVFKRGQLGTVTHKSIGAEQWDYYRSHGWYDSPDKVPLSPGQTAEVKQPAPVYNAPVKPYGAFGSVHGEVAPEAHAPAKADHDSRGKFAKGNTAAKARRR